MSELLAENNGTLAKFSSNGALGFNFRLRHPKSADKRDGQIDFKNVLILSPTLKDHNQFGLLRILISYNWNSATKLDSTSLVLISV